LAAPRAASSRVARYSFTARLASLAARSLFHSAPRDRTLLVGVRHDQAGIDCKPFAADQLCRNARFYNTLEETAANVTVTKRLIACARERRVIRDLTSIESPQNQR